jgi:hypothetical protein
MVERAGAEAVLAGPVHAVKPDSLACQWAARRALRSRLIRVGAGRQVAGLQRISKSYPLAFTKVDSLACQWEAFI